MQKPTHSKYKINFKPYAHFYLEPIRNTRNVNLQILNAGMALQTIYSRRENRLSPIGLDLFRRYRLAQINFTKETGFNKVVKKRLYFWLSLTFTVRTKIVKEHPFCQLQ